MKTILSFLHKDKPYELLHSTADDSRHCVDVAGQHLFRIDADLHIYDARGQHVGRMSSGRPNWRLCTTDQVYKDLYVPVNNYCYLKLAKAEVEALKLLLG